MDIPTPGNPKSEAGQKMENYKSWYYSQPKLVKVAVLPFVIAISATIPSMLSFNGWKLGIAFTIFSIALALNLYNQYLDSILIENIASIEARAKRFEHEMAKYNHLNMIFEELVMQKATMFLKTLSILNGNKEQGRVKAIDNIRKANTYDHNLSRLFALLKKTLDKHARIERAETFRVVYMEPSDESDRLTAEIFFPSDDPPRSIRNKSKDFQRDGKSVAAYVWRRDEESPFIIDDIPSYIENHRDNPESIFCYTNNAQKEYLKSLLCYRVSDHRSGDTLGVICIDSNVPNAFEEHLGVEFCKRLVESFSKRIIYETWFGAMKASLGPYAQEAL